MKNYLVKWKILKDQKNCGFHCYGSDVWGEFGLLKTKMLKAQGIDKIHEKHKICCWCQTTTKNLLNVLFWLFFPLMIIIEVFWIPIMWFLKLVSKNKLISFIVIVGIFTILGVVLELVFK